MVMRSYNYSAIKNQKWDCDILKLVANIYKYVGKQELYLKQKPKELERLVEIAKVQSTRNSNITEDIYLSDTRVRQLVEGKTTPKNIGEQAIAGYISVLNAIHKSFDPAPITKDYILYLHGLLYSYMDNPPTPNDFFDTLDNICEEYNRVIGNNEIEPLIAIPVFIRDFLWIYPFNDGNFQLSIPLTTLLLYRCGFYVGKYISLETKIKKNKDMYYEAIKKSQEDAVLFIKYLLGIILGAYKDLEERYLIVEEKLPAVELVRKATKNKVGMFTKQDVRQLCPSLSISSIEGALRKLVNIGELKRRGIGKETCYVRTDG